MTLLEWLMLGGAAALAGALNAVAGGGSFLTLPALALAGVPLIAANATGTAALLPGYLASAWSLRRELAAPMTPSLLRMSLLSIGGGAVGALLLLSTSSHFFALLVPWLLLLATVLFAYGQRLIARRAELPPAAPNTLKADLCILAVAIYGGYFNGGLGILLLAVLGFLGHTDLTRMNGVKNFISAILTLFAVLIYAADGAIVWLPALWMAVGATLGGYIGGSLLRRLSPKFVRRCIVLTGLAMSAAFFYQSY
ncbi:sulfite exporter TauE/SafE family protein [Kerstersia sp.]|uniref:sulfite exporter TauE/SafE family protein n=1 Tax=Kerstersia sp. TaxID=1930783 RepID=UPI003F8F6A2B